MHAWPVALLSTCSAATARTAGSYNYVAAPVIIVDIINTHRNVKSRCDFKKWKIIFTNDYPLLAPLVLVARCLCETLLYIASVMATQNIDSKCDKKKGNSGRKEVICEIMTLSPSNPGHGGARCSKKNSYAYFFIYLLCFLIPIQQ